MKVKKHEDKGSYNYSHSLGGATKEEREAYVQVELFQKDKENQYLQENIQGMLQQENEPQPKGEQSKGDN